MQQNISDTKQQTNLKSDGMHQSEFKKNEPIRNKIEGSD